MHILHNRKYRSRMQTTSEGKFPSPKSSSRIMQTSAFLNSTSLELVVTHDGNRGGSGSICGGGSSAHINFANKVQIAPAIPQYDSHVVSLTPSSGTTSQLARVHTENFSNNKKCTPLGPQHHVASRPSLIQSIPLSNQLVF